MGKTPKNTASKPDTSQINVDTTPAVHSGPLNIVTQQIGELNYFDFRNRTQQIIGFISALAITNALSKIFIDPYVIDINTQSSAMHGNSILFSPSFTERAITQMAFFAVVFVLIVRFYYGNCSQIFSKRYATTKELAGDSLFSLVQHVLLAVMSIFLNYPPVILFLIMVLFATDLAWIIVRALFNASNGDKISGADIKNQVNSLIFCAVIAILLYKYPFTYWFDYNNYVNFSIFFFFFIANTAYDIYLNGEKYIRGDT